ncbi:aspartate/tyrosine/aromatic aminotransferase [Oxalobacter vibrioformis]|uniref:Aminotransferase n=1 Tax=Oxalobacter vibrioformis TaxID=933080 RepID=A0A9E9LUD7_9BURK|nr:amino acid aminotransferase [Oxalobacter vibrioformis]WAW09800.1 aspartate/tyrosine/aromatic aminotransferase [Oxalobacter vibrioformis]
MSQSIPEPLFSAIPMAPRDPILGITESFNADQNPEKINLGVGVYYDDNGKVPLLKCVQQAETMMLEKAAPHTYLPIDGLPAFNTAVQKMVFGEGCRGFDEKRIMTVQALGGTGALRIGADFISRFSASSHIWISNPSWENHRALFEADGFTVHTYPYYDGETRSINFNGMIAELKSMPSGSTVLLHACCHNPTGLDLSDGQWDEVIAVISERSLIPFLDMAYQGFAQSLEADGRIIRRFADNCPYLLVSNSYSKSFSLYGERIGAFSFVARSADEATRALSQVKRVIRTNYSNPSRHGAEIVTTVLSSPELYTMWDNELSDMRSRIRQMREKLAQDLSALREDLDFSYIITQNGLFSYSGLNKKQVEQLRDEHSIYAVDTGRICVAALNSGNIGRVVKAIAQVL